MQKTVSGRQYYGIIGIIILVALVALVAYTKFKDQIYADTVVPTGVLPDTTIVPDELQFSQDSYTPVPSN
jgi:hypothetical protein